MAYSPVRWDFAIVQDEGNLYKKNKRNIKNVMRCRGNILAVWRLFGSVLSRCFFAPLGVLFVMKMNGTLL